jgi:hypothetical protein
MPVGVSDVERRDLAIRQFGGKQLKYPVPCGDRSGSVLKTKKP